MHGKARQNNACFRNNDNKEKIIGKIQAWRADLKCRLLLQRGEIKKPASCRMDAGSL
jgi:hypothetical protein